MAEIFVTYQHGSSQIELVKELCDENMHFEHIGHIFAFNVSQDIYEPLKISVRRTDPQKVHFFAGHSRITIG